MSALTSDEKLVRMANQIATFFRSYPEEEAVAGIQKHIKAFWTPKMIAHLEAALPERFVRDAGGNLLSIDARALNYEKIERQEVQWGFNFSRPFGQPTPQAAPGQGNPGGPGARGPGAIGPHPRD